MPTTTQQPQVAGLLAQLTMLVAALTPRPVEEPRDSQEYSRQMGAADDIVNSVQEALSDQVRVQFERFMELAYDADKALLRDTLATYSLHSENGSERGLLMAFSHVLRRDGLDAILCDEAEGKLIRSLLEVSRSKHWVGQLLESIHMVMERPCNEGLAGLTLSRMDFIWQDQREQYHNRRATAAEFIETYGEAALAEK